jgi:hypothetical protein
MMAVRRVPAGPEGEDEGDSRWLQERSIGAPGVGACALHFVAGSQSGGEGQVFDRITD